MVLSIRERIKLLNEHSEKPLQNSFYNQDVMNTFSDFISLVKVENFAIIGAIAVGKFNIPRMTSDIDLVILSDSDINTIYNQVKSKFNKIRKHAIEHKKYGVEIELLTPDFIEQSTGLVKLAILTAKIDKINGHNVKVVTPKYLIALKLGRAVKDKGRKGTMDIADIKGLLEEYGKFDLSSLKLSKDQMKLYDQILKDLGL